MKEVKKGKNKKVKEKENIKSERIVKAVILLAYILILSLSWYDFYNLKSGDEIGFTLFYFYFLLPIITLVVAIYIGKDTIKDLYKILLIILLSFLYMSPLFIFVIKGEFSILNLLGSYYDLMFNGLIISLIGLIIGLIIKTRKDKCKKK